MEEVNEKSYILLGAIILLFIVIGAIAFSMLYNPSTEYTKEQKRFVGSKKSDIYHYPSCGHAKRIKPENEIWFSSSQDARNHGYRPCKVCNPP